MNRSHGATALALLFALWAAGCSDDDLSPDAGVARDLARFDGPLADRAVDRARADVAVADQGRDGSSPLPGVGKISGHCGVLDDTEWKAASPFFFRNAIDLGTAKFDEKKLSAGGQQIFSEGNLGGSSVHSEIFSHELLYRCELAKLLKTEGKISYQDKGGKKTDLLLQIDGRKVGVSVTRAYHYPPGNPYTEAEAKQLLDKKLADLPKSKANATTADAWTRSMLHVLAYNKQYADAVQAAWSKQVNSAVKGDAILILTVTDGKDDVIY